MTKTLNVALIGQGFMGRAHSNAYCQVGHFFDLPFVLHRKAICGRNREALEKMAATWGWDETATDWRAVTFAPDAYWRGETHRLCDRAGGLIRLVESF